MWPQILVYIHFTLLECAHEQYASNITHISLHYCYSLYIDPTLLHIEVQKITNCNFNYHAIAIFVATTNMPLKCHICQLVHVQMPDNYISIYTSYEPTAINNVARDTGIHTFHIIGICLVQICLQHDTYMPHCLQLWSTYRSHITAHKSYKRRLQLLITMLLLYMWHQQICHWNTWYAN